MHARASWTFVAAVSYVTGCSTEGPRCEVVLGCVFRGFLRDCNAGRWHSLRGSWLSCGAGLKSAMPSSSAGSGSEMSSSERCLASPQAKPRTSNAEPQTPHTLGREGGTLSPTPRWRRVTVPPSAQLRHEERNRALIV